MALDSFDYLMIFLVMFGFMFMVYYFDSMVGNSVVLNLTAGSVKNTSLCNDVNCTALKNQLSSFVKTTTSFTTTSTLKVVVFNTSGALASMISSNDTNILINCGSDPKVMDRLFMNGIDLLKYVMIERMDFEHAGGCERMLKSIPHNMIYDTGGGVEEEWFIGYLFAVGDQRILVNNTKRIKSGSMNIDASKTQSGMDVVIRIGGNAFLFSDYCGGFGNITSIDVAVCDDEPAESLMVDKKPSVIIINSNNETAVSLALKYGKTLILKDKLGSFAIRTDGQKIYTSFKG